MKLNPKETSTQPQIFESPHQQAMYDMFEEWDDDDMWDPGPMLTNKDLKKPNPPTPEAIEKAQFVDKTYVWSGK